MSADKNLLGEIFKATLISAMAGAVSVFGMTLVMEEKINNLQLIAFEIKADSRRVDDELEAHRLMDAHAVARSKLENLEHRTLAMETQNAQMYTRILTELERLSSAHN